MVEINLNFPGDVIRDEVAHSNCNPIYKWWTRWNHLYRLSATMGLNWQHCKYQLRLRELDSGWKLFVPIVLCSFLFSVGQYEGQYLLHPPLPLSLYSAFHLTHSCPRFLSLPRNRFSSMWPSINGGGVDRQSLVWIAIGSQLIQRFSAWGTRNMDHYISHSVNLFKIQKNIQWGMLQRRSPGSARSSFW
jgi:hypothetical protein